MKKMRQKAAYVKKVVAGGMEVEPEVFAGSMDMKAKLLAVIGAELVGRASASGGVLPTDEVDALMVTGIILMVIGALWVARQAVGFMAVGVKRLRKVMVRER